MPSDKLSVGPYRNVRLDTWLYIDEIIHRTMNDYTAILAIVRRAAAVALDETSGQALEDVAIRLRAAVESLRVLRPPHDGQVRNLGKELGSLCATLTSSVVSAQAITLNLAFEPVLLSAYRCWQILLIFSELITNSERHAFQHAEKGSVSIRVRVEDGTVRCAITDDGVFRHDAVPRWGAEIINRLISELGGSITKQFSDIGTTVLLTVPLAEPFIMRDLRPQRESTLPIGQSLSNSFHITVANDDDA